MIFGRADQPDFVVLHRQTNTVLVRRKLDFNAGALAIFDRVDSLQGNRYPPPCKVYHLPCGPAASVGSVEGVFPKPNFGNSGVAVLPCPEGFLGE